MNFLLKFVDLVDYLLYGALLIVTCWWLYHYLAAELDMRRNQYRYRMRLKRQQLKFRTQSMPKAYWFKHLYNLFAIRKANTDISTVYVFLVVEAFLAIGVFSLMVFRLQDLFLAIACAAITLLIPYLFLVVSARNIRSEIGSGVPELVQTLIHSYSATRHDMYSALTMTHQQMKQVNLQRVVARLVSDLQTAHDEETMREVIDFFIFTTGSSWGMRLGNIILKAYVYQENVNTALLTLQQQMVMHQKMVEEEKAESADVFLQSALAIVLFPVSLIGANYITNPQNWWVLQFQEPIAFGSFVITTLFVLIAVLIGIIVRKPQHNL